MFSLADILDADGGDAYTSISDLSNLTISFTFTVPTVGSATTSGYASLFSISGPIGASTPTANFSSYLAGLSSGVSATYTDNGTVGLNAGDNLHANLYRCGFKRWG